jgi:hypothetical protein
MNKSQRERLLALLEELVPDARDRDRWLELLALVAQPETWRASPAEQDRLTPLPKFVAHTPVTLAAARQRLAGMDPAGAEHRALASEIEAYESLNRDSLRERERTT